MKFRDRLTGRTTGFGPVNAGSNPAPGSITRRTFLRGAIAAAATLGAAELLVPSRKFFLPPPGGWPRAHLADLFEYARGAPAGPLKFDTIVWEWRELEPGERTEFPIEPWGGPDLVTANISPRSYQVTGLTVAKIREAQRILEAGGIFGDLIPIPWPRR